MTTLLLIVMGVLVIAVLERTNRRQPLHPPGLFGTQGLEDRDWARTKLDLLALGDRPRRNATHRNDPRAG